MARRWVKIWVNECLTGTVRFDFTPAERSVWYDLVILAGNCRMEGVVAAGSGRPYPHNWIAGTLNIPLELLEVTLTKCEESGRIREDGDGIHILNWQKYQSEYERQKPYRNPKLQPTVIGNSYTGDIEGDKEEKKVIKTGKTWRVAN